MNITQHVTDAVVSIRDFYGMSLGDTRVLQFSEWPSIKRGRGVYIIIDGDEVIYVGRGNIRARQESHHKKLTGGLTKHDNKEPKGWVYLREHRNIDCDKLRLIIVYLKYKDDEAAMEGGLIKKLQPYTNDEIFSKNTILGNL